MTDDELKRRLQKCLDGMGNIYTISDIVELVRSHKMQWWQDGDLVSITQISDFPQKRILICVATFGAWTEPAAQRLHNKITEFGRAEGCEHFITEGRKGWEKVLGKMGWKTTGITLRYKL